MHAIQIEKGRIAMSAASEPASKDIYGKPFNRKLLVAVLLVGAFVTILNQTLLATALPKIMEDMGIEPTTGQWLTTAFLLTNGIMIPLTALLIEKFPSRQLFLMAMSIFAAGTAVCAFAGTFEWLLAGRIIQAVGAGIMMPLMQTIMLTIHPIEKRGAAMGLVGLVIAFAPAIGPTVSGYIVDILDWHYLFYIVFPIVLLDIVFGFFAMKNVMPLANPKIDALSITLSTIGFGSLLYGFSSAGNSGWTDPFVIGTILIGAIGLVFFTKRQLSLKRPMLELRVFKSRTFILTAIVACICFMGIIGSSIILPIYIQSIHGKSAFYSGLVLLPGAILMGMMGPVSGRIFDRYGARWMAIIGMCIHAAATVPFVFLEETTPMWWIAAFHALRMFGLSLVTMPLTTAGINSLPGKLLSHGTAVNNTMRQVAASIGTALLITIMSNVTYLHMPDASLAATDKAAYSEQMAQASLHGVNASFFATLVTVLIACILVLFVKDRKGLAVKKAEE